MAFFDDIGRKISDVGQTTIQKTRDMTETLRYNSLISEEEKAIQGNFTIIGEMYFNEIKNCAEGDYIPYVNQINESISRIDDYRSKIENIKAVGKCPHCGAFVSPGDLFCGVCGYKQEKKTDAHGVCTNCGKPLTADAEFCIYCGVKIEKPTMTEAVVQPPIVEQLEADELKVEESASFIDSNEE